MRATFTLAGLCAAVIAPEVALAQVPAKIEVETCWFGVCAGVTSRYHTIVTAPIFAPTDGELWNSQGYAGDFSYDPSSGSLFFLTYRYPIGIYTGSYVNGCLSGTAVQYYYNGYGSFESLKGCP